MIRIAIYDGFVETYVGQMDNEDKTLDEVLLTDYDALLTSLDQLREYDIILTTLDTPCKFIILKRYNNTVLGTTDTPPPITTQKITKK